MKDALGHGSAAHQAGVMGLARSFIRDTSGVGKAPHPNVIPQLMAKHGDWLDPGTLGELPATRIVGHLMGWG